MQIDLPRCVWLTERKKTRGHPYVELTPTFYVLLKEKNRIGENEIFEVYLVLEDEFVKQD